jgi:simple sugar transport system substrate-binding protein
MLVQGVQLAVDEKGAAMSIVEGGFVQAEWEQSLTAMAASGRYALIVSSNPSLPSITAAVLEKFPKQRFLLLDAELAGNASVYTLRYNQREQAYMAGYIAALETAENLGNHTAAALGTAGLSAGERRVGLIAGLEYPAMNDVILPGYAEGAQAVDPDFSVDFRVLGNWFDAGKAAEIGADMVRGGVYVILCIAGGANEGIVQAAAEAGAKVIWFDTNGYAVRRGTVAGSSVVHQNKAAYEKTKLFLEGALPFGKAELVGVSDGYVDFVEDDPAYRASVSEAVRARQAEMIARIRDGSLLLRDERE